VERAGRIQDPRVAIQVNEKRVGLGDSVLNALSTITTPYVAVLNSDDLFHPERLERCLAVLKQDPDVQVVATALITIDAAGCRLTPDNLRPLSDGPDITNWIQWFARARRVEPGADQLAELLERNYLITSSNIVSRTDFLRSRREALQPEDVGLGRGRRRRTAGLRREEVAALSDMSADYYSRLLNGRPLPVMVVEGGWTSAAAGTIQSSPELQARYITRHAQLLDAVRARGLIQLLFADIDLASLPPPVPPNLPLFVSIGVTDSNFIAKPALTSWDALHARRLVP